MKTKETEQLEHDIRAATRKVGVFGCFEVTIGYAGKERVDFMTYEPAKKVFRCYEIKVTKEDFHSPAKKSFLGDFNYYVLTRELWAAVKEEIQTQDEQLINRLKQRISKAEKDAHKQQQEWNKLFQRIADKYGYDEAWQMAKGERQEEARCKWRQASGEYDGEWDTDCGHTFWICEGTPKENGMRVCTYCGKKLIGIPNKESGDG